MMNTTIRTLAVMLGALTLATGASAATTSGSGTMGSSASVVAECAVSLNTAIAFSKLTMLNAATAAQTTEGSAQAGSFNAICTNGTKTPQFTYVSTGGGSTAFQLTGDDGTTKITYSLHPDTAGTATAIVPSTATTYASFNADGTAQILNISATVLATDKAAKKVQNYSDTITITTSFGV